MSASGRQNRREGPTGRLRALARLCLAAPRSRARRARGSDPQRAPRPVLRLPVLRVRRRRLHAGAPRGAARAGRATDRGSAPAASGAHASAPSRRRGGCRRPRARRRREHRPGLRRGPAADELHAAALAARRPRRRAQDVRHGSRAREGAGDDLALAAGGAARPAAALGPRSRPAQCRSSGWTSTPRCWSSRSPSWTRFQFSNSSPVIGESWIGASSRASAVARSSSARSRSASTSSSA
jgi:hypothetical protein